MSLNLLNYPRVCWRTGSRPALDPGPAIPREVQRSRRRMRREVEPFRRIDNFAADEEIVFVKPIDPSETGMDVFGRTHDHETTSAGPNRGCVPNALGIPRLVFLFIGMRTAYRRL